MWPQMCLANYCHTSLTTPPFRQFVMGLTVIMSPTLIGGGIKQCFYLTSVWRLTSVAYIGPKSRTERPRKTKNGIEIVHVKRDSDTTFKVKRSKVTRPLYSPSCWRVRRLQRWAWEHVGSGKLLLRCHLLGRARSLGVHRRRRRGRGHIVSAAPLQLVIIVFIFTSANKVMFSIGINLFVCFLSTVSSLQWHGCAVLYTVQANLSCTSALHDA